MRVNIDPLYNADFSLPRFAVLNAVSEAVYSAATGEPLAARSPFTYNYWLNVGDDTLTVTPASPIAADYLALYYRDADGTTTLTPQWFDGLVWANFGDPVIPVAGDGSLIWLSDQVPSANAIRLVVTGGNIKICNFKAGTSTQIPVGLPVGYEPAVLNPQDEYTSVRSVKGQILGSNKERTGIREDLNFQSIPFAWVRATWPAIKTAMETEGVYFAWYPEQFEDDLVYGIMVDTPRVRYNNVIHQDIQLRLEGPSCGV